MPKETISSDNTQRVEKIIDDLYLARREIERLKNIIKAYNLFNATRKEMQHQQAHPGFDNLPAGECGQAYYPHTGRYADCKSQTNSRTSEGGCMKPTAFGAINQ